MRVAVLALFFLSGAAALVYEVSWARQIGLLFGHTAYAAAITLGAYFAGMAVGYAVVGRRVANMARPLFGYGIAELGVAAWALLTPPLVSMLEHPALSQLISPADPLLQLTVRSLVAFCMLMPATIALGATLPLIAAHLNRASDRPGGVALAYGLNTLGAVAGVLLATFVLLVHVGVRGSGYLAAVVSALCGVAGLWLGRSTPASPAVVKTSVRPIARRWYVIAALAGGTTLALELLYTRLFALVFPNSTYTFGLVVAAFLISLSLGGLIASRLIARPGSVIWIARSALALVITIPASVWGFVAATDLSSFSGGTNFWSHVGAALALVIAVTVVPVTLAGLILPLTWAAAGGEDGRTVGVLTAINTACAALGSMLASFALLPLLGLWHAFTLVGALYLLVGFGALRGKLSRAPIFCALACVVFLSAYSVIVGGSDHGYSRRTHERLGHWESAYGWIDVLRERATGRLDLKHNSRYRLSSSQLSHYEVRQGHIPLLLHPSPRRVLYLGMATGVTASSALSHPEVESAEIVELIPDVVEAARMFSDYNLGIVDAEKASIVLNDARHHLHQSRDDYDVIVSDLFIPWESKTGYLYTAEHYRAVRARLAEGGVFCQWIHLWEVGPRELELIADTLATVFPVVTLWKVDMKADVPVLGMVASESPLRVDGEQLSRRMAQLAAPPGKAKMLHRPGNLLALYMGRWAVRNPGLLNTDEHPRVEFLAPVSHSAGGLFLPATLKAYYRDVFLRLELTGLDYIPPPRKPAFDLSIGRQVQFARLQGN